MNKILKTLAVLGCVVSLSACSSSAASKKSSAEEGIKAVETKYDKKADVSAMTFVDNEFHGLTFRTPDIMRGRKDSKKEELSFSVKGNKNKLEVLYDDSTALEEGTAEKLKLDEKWNLLSSEEKEINGLKVIQCKGVTTVFTQIVEDADSDLYLVEAPEGGVIAFDFIYDPDGEEDYAPVYEEIVNSIKAK